VISNKIALANEHMLLLRQQRVFNSAKENLPKGQGDRMYIDFVRFKAQRYHIEGLVDRGDGDTIFSQMLRILKRDHGNYENNFRRDSLETRVWKANFLHEGSIDDGGPYRESMENISYELTSGVLPLLVKTPNQISKSGLRQECFVFNPLARSEKELEMFRFFGILMGFAVRSE